jgi:hypothetical protein
MRTEEQPLALQVGGEMNLGSHRRTVDFLPAGLPPAAAPDPRPADDQGLYPKVRPGERRFPFARPFRTI